MNLLDTPFSAKAHMAPLPEVAALGQLWDEHWRKSPRSTVTSSLASSDNLVRRPVDPTGFTAAETFDASLSQNRWTGHTQPCGFYMPASVFIGRSVVEIGCGFGHFGAHLKPWVRRYLGIEASRHAYSIARGGSGGPDTRFAHVSDQRLFRDLAGCFDVMVCRELFLHLSEAHASFVLDLVARLLRPGGRAMADFTTLTVERYPFAVRPGAKQQHTTEPALLYEYSDASIYGLASAFGFRVDALETVPSLNTKFALLTKA